MPRCGMQPKVDVHICVCAFSLTISFPAVKMEVQLISPSNALSKKNVWNCYVIIYRKTTNTTQPLLKLQVIRHSDRNQQEGTFFLRFKLLQIKFKTYYIIIDNMIRNRTAFVFM